MTDSNRKNRILFRGDNPASLRTLSRGAVREGAEIEPPVVTLPGFETLGAPLLAAADVARASLFRRSRMAITYTHPSAVPIPGTPATYRYLAGALGVDAAVASLRKCNRADCWGGADPRGDRHPRNPFPFRQ